MRIWHPIERTEQVKAVEANRDSSSLPIEAERRRSGLGQPIDKHRQGRPSSAAVKRSALRPLNPTFAGKSGCGDVPDALAELDATIGEILDAVDLLRSVRFPSTRDAAGAAVVRVRSSGKFGSTAFIRTSAGVR